MALLEALAIVMAAVITKIKRGEVILDSEIAAAFQSAITPYLIDVASAQARIAGLNMAIGFDETALNAAMTQWAKEYTDALVTGLTATTRRVIDNAIVEFNKTTAMTRDALAKLLEPAFGKNRAEIIAITEVTRAYSEGTNYLQQELAKSGIQTERFWITARDEKVCFPKDTLVTTNTGYKAIQNIRVGDTVLTLSGPQQVKATMQHVYTGVMVTLRAGKHWITSTAEHPFWVLQKGWLNAVDIQVGDRLKSLTNDVCDVNTVFHFIFADANHTPSHAMQKSGLAFVSGGVLVPICSIGLYRNSLKGQGKIDRIASDAVFLLKVDSQSRQSMSHRLFQQGLRLGTAIASKTTKLSGRVTRAYTKPFAATFALYIIRGATALFTAIMAIESPFGSKSLSASLANNIFSARQATYSTTNRVPISNGITHSKVLPANRANLGNHRRRRTVDMTSGGTETLAPFNSAHWPIKFLAAVRTNNIFPKTTSRMVMFCRTIFCLLQLALQRFSAILTCHHITKQLYHKNPELYSGLVVYNLEMRESPTFYANGILVHNCPICLPLDGKSENGWKFTMPWGPPAHVRCRCDLLIRPIRQAKSWGNGDMIRIYPVWNSLVTA